MNRDCFFCVITKVAVVVLYLLVLEWKYFVLMRVFFMKSTKARSISPVQSNSSETVVGDNEQCNRYESRRCDVLRKLLAAYLLILLRIQDGTRAQPVGMLHLWV